MDWCVGSGVTDFLVPEDCEILDRFLMPESWLQWGRTDYESMESLSKCIVPQKAPTPEVHLGIPSSHLMENGGSTRCGVLSKGSLHHSTNPYEQPSSLPNEKVGTDLMDDIFLSSLLDEDTPLMEGLNEPFGLCPEFQYNSMSTDDSFSRRVPGDFYGMKSSKCLKTDDFSPSWGGKMEECAASHFTPSTLGREKDFRPVEGPMVKIPVSMIQSKAMSEETSVEESVLQDLEGVMVQLPHKTRICFRDALYRLAKNSEQQHEITEGYVEEFNVEPTALADVIPRSGTNMESKTNTIDRTIANLMFNKIESTLQTSNQQGGDAEVPIISRENPQRTSSLLFQALV